jgi:hypothetical protein
MSLKCSIKHLFQAVAVGVDLYDGTECKDVRGFCNELVTERPLMFPQIQVLKFMYFNVPI